MGGAPVAGEVVAGDGVAELRPVRERRQPVGVVLHVRHEARAVEARALVDQRAQRFARRPAS